MSLDVPGPLRFLRYAYAPNSLGYCGPDSESTLAEYGRAAVVDGGLVDLLHTFEGAWPYLEFLAGSAGVGDALDPGVVEAYWIGNDLLTLIDQSAFVRSLEERFSRRTTDWSSTVEAVAPGAQPNHAFHVFRVYPWVGLMRTGAVDAPLHVLDQCRIAWGRVAAVAGETATVEVQPLEWAGSGLRLGEPRTRSATLRSEPHSDDLSAGAFVSVHWDQVCESITKSQVETLRHHTTTQLAWANRQLAPAFA